MFLNYFLSNGITKQNKPRSYYLWFIVGNIHHVYYHLQLNFILTVIIIIMYIICYVVFLFDMSTGTVI